MIEGGKIFDKNRQMLKFNITIISRSG